MSDLISRQAAIDAIEEYADRLQMVNWKENPNVPYKVHSLNWCINTIRDLPSAQPEQRWIAVTERLPGEFVSVQAHMTDAESFPSVREAYLAGGEWFFPALNEYHPVDKWAEFLESSEEDET